METNVYDKSGIMVIGLSGCLDARHAEKPRIYSFFLQNNSFAISQES